MRDNFGLCILNLRRDGNTWETDKLQGYSFSVVFASA